jgi:hypothetical protein
MLTIEAGYGKRKSLAPVDSSGRPFKQRRSEMTTSLDADLSQDLQATPRAAETVTPFASSLEPAMHSNSLDSNTPTTSSVTTLQEDSHDRNKVTGTLPPLPKAFLDGIQNGTFPDLEPKAELLSFVRAFFDETLSETEILFFWKENLIVIRSIYEYVPQVQHF